MAKKKFNVKKIMSKVGGAATGGAIGQASNKVLGKFDPKIGAGVKILAGAVLPELAPKSEFVSEMGSGMIGVGAAELLKSFVPGLAGIGADDMDQSLGAVENDYIIDGMGMGDLGADDPDNAIGDLGEEDYSSDEY